MKKIILLLLIQLISACSHQEISKPEKPQRSVDEEKMFKEISTIMKNDKIQFAKEVKLGYTNVQGILGESFAHNAVFIGRIDLLELLVDNQVSLDIQDDFGVTPLMLAIQLNKNDISDYLITKGTDLNKKDFMGNTALMKAVEKGSESVVESLIGRKADKNIVNDLGQRAVDLASNPDIIELLK